MLSVAVSALGKTSMLAVQYAPSYYYYEYRTLYPRLFIPECD